MDAFISHYLYWEHMNSQEETIGIILAGIVLDCRVMHPESRRYLRKYMEDPKGSKHPVCLDQEDMEVIRTHFPADQPAYESEIKMLPAALSDALLPYGRLIFHAVALVVGHKAWLLAAPSGTGKTTQYRNLKKLHPDAVTILCGDNPILQFMEDRNILVHHSPWNGKEGYGCIMTAPLAGLILLEQSESNELSKLSQRDAVVPIFRQIHTTLKTEMDAHLVFQLEEKLLKSIPMWKFRNRGDMESSGMLYELIRNKSKMF